MEPETNPHIETAKKLVAPYKDRFSAVHVNVPHAIEQIAQELAEGRSEAEIDATLASDLAVMEKGAADRADAAAKYEAEQKAEAARIERLSTAAIIVGHLIQTNPTSAAQSDIVNLAVGYADRLIAAVASPTEA